MKNLISRINYSVKIFDVFIILLVILGLLLFKLFFSNSNEEVYLELEYSPVTYNSIEPVPINYWISERVTSNATVYDLLGKNAGEVISTSSIDYGAQFKLFTTLIKLEVVKDNQSGFYTFNDQPLIVGDFLQLNINNTRFEGKIVGLHGSIPEKETRTMAVVAVAKSLDSEFLEIYRSLEGETFSGGLLFKEIIDEKRSDYDSFNLINGQLRVSSQDLTDMEILLELPVECDESGVCYFNKNQPVKKGLTLWAQNSDAALSNLLITDIVSK